MPLPYDVTLGQPLVAQLPKESQDALHLACKVIPGFRQKVDHLEEYWVDPKADADIAGTMLCNVVKLLIAYLRNKTQ